MADDSALVFVAPSDTTDTIIQKIRGAGAKSVELLVPDGTPALQAQGGFARLRQAIERDRISLLVISSDEQTLNAAQLNRFDTVGIQGARVMPPAARDNGEQAAPSPTRDRTTVPIAAADAEFLDALDQMSPEDRAAAEDGADLYTALDLDDLSAAAQSSPATGRAPRADDEFAAALDEWSAGDSGRRDAAGWDEGRAPSAPRRRVRAEDLEISDDELRRQRGARRTRAAATPVFDREADEAIAPRRVGLGLAIPLLLLALVAASAAFWYVRSRVTIAVAAPATTTSQQPFQNEVIPLAAGTDKSAGAVQADPVSADAQFQVQGQVISETLSPAGTAKGTVTVINRIEQPIQLAAGTQFIAVKGQGQEVRFKLDQPVTVPPATTTSSLTGISTTFGQIEVAITALSPGSASNVGENAIKQIVIPGQQPITTDTGNFTLRNAPIGGGNEQPVRLVTEADVQRTLQEALTGLYNAGIQELQGKLGARAQDIDPVSIIPDADELGKPQNYEIAVEPPVGTQVDTNNPNFTVTVKARFSALAAPRGQLVGTQLTTVLPEHFRSPCKPGETARYDLSDYRWDGQRLAVDGTITCTPSGGLTPGTVNRVKLAVSGKSRTEAEQNLRALQQEGLIGGYTLPAGREQFPRLDFLLTVVEAQPAQPRPTPTP